MPNTIFRLYLFKHLTYYISNTHPMKFKFVVESGNYNAHIGGEDHSLLLHIPDHLADFPMKIHIHGVSGVFIELISSSSDSSILSSVIRSSQFPDCKLPGYERSSLNSNVWLTRETQDSKVLWDYLCHYFDIDSSIMNQVNDAISKFLS